MFRIRLHIERGQGNAINNVVKLYALKLDYFNVNVQVQPLSNAMLSIDETDFDEIVNHCIADLGVQQTIETIIFPFMCKASFMWQVNTINISKPFLKLTNPL